MDGGFLHKEMRAGTTKRIPNAYRINAISMAGSEDPMWRTIPVTLTKNRPVNTIQPIPTSGF
jgi:hypothetical protein